MTPPATLLPALRLESRYVAAAPVVRHFLERLDVLGFLQRHLPPLPGRQSNVPTHLVLVALLTNFLLARQPLYALSAWASTFVPEHLGLRPEHLPRLNDDRFGRALDHLRRADCVSLWTAPIHHVVRAFRLDLAHLHLDTTTITFTGGMPTNRPLRTSTVRHASHTITTRTTAPT